MYKLSERDIVIIYDFFYYSFNRTNNVSSCVIKMQCLNEYLAFQQDVQIKKIDK